MRRTRKWSFVAQEAARLAALGLSPLDIAKRLEVNKSTVTRWMAQGKLTRTRGHQQPKTSSAPPVTARIGQTPSEWAKSVRAEYSLDATDDQLVTLAESALELSLNDRVAAHVRMTAAGRFQALVRQLALVARREDAQPVAPPAAAPVAATAEKPAPRVVRRSSTDPRKHLMALVKA